MRKYIALLVFCGSCMAQMINPNQIRPSATNGQVLETVSGATAWATPAAPPVTSVSAADASLTVTPTTGAITAKINNAVTPGCPTTSLCFNAYGLYTGPQFAFTFVCSAVGSFEIGYASINPNTCTYTYSNGTAGSATLTDSASHTGTVNAPYTSGTLAYSYMANTTFTGNATSTTSQSAPQQTTSIAFLPCTFSGLSTGGTATGATASGSATGNICANETAMLTGLTGTLASNGLGNTYAGQSFVFSSPAGSHLSLLLTGGCGHTLTVGGFTTTFNTYAFTYTNIEGGSQTGMCIYTSPAPASIPTTVVVSSL